jgi:hypothetical protein
MAFVLWLQLEFRSRVRNLCFCGGYGAEPAVTAFGAAEAAASGSVPWRAADQEEHV